MRKGKKDFVSEMGMFTVCSIMLKCTIYFTEFFLLFFSHSVFVMSYAQSTHTHTRALVPMLNIMKTNNSNNSSENSLTINSTPKKAHELNLISQPTLSLPHSDSRYYIPHFSSIFGYFTTSMCVVRLHLHRISLKSAFCTQNVCLCLCVCHIVVFV